MFKKEIQINIGKPNEGETIMKSKARHVDDGGGNPRVHGRFKEQMRFEKNRTFTKDITIQIGKPK